MKTSLIALAATTAAVFALSQQGCSKSSNSSSPTATPTATATPTLTATPTPGPVSFSADVVPVFAADCNSGSCHAAVAPVLVGTTAAVYATIRTGTAVVDTADAAASTLVCSPLAGGCSPQCSSDPFTSTTSADYVTLLNWIQQGAKQN